MENFKGFYHNKSKKVNKWRSVNPLAHLSYRQLQEEAQNLNLPSNIKYKFLLALVIAKKQHRDDIVKLILEDNKKSRSTTCKVRGSPPLMLCAEQLNSFACSTCIPLQHSHEIPNYSSTSTTKTFFDDSTAAAGNTSTIWNPENTFSNPVFDATPGNNVASDVNPNEANELDLFFAQELQSGSVESAVSTTGHSTDVDISGSSLLSDIDFV